MRESKPPFDQLVNVIMESFASRRFEDALDGRRRRRRIMRVPLVSVLLLPLFCSTLFESVTAFVPSGQQSARRSVSPTSLFAKKQTSNSTNKVSSSKPAFSQAAHQSSNLNDLRQPQQQRPTRQFRGDSKVGTLHEQRIKTAGRVGTKRYVNPCKIFVGNLPFSVTSEDLKNWICKQLGLPSAVLLQECKIIRDWKTGKSKGYGFAVFTEAIYATVCIVKCNGLVWDGRTITVNQGVKKQPESELYIKKERKKPADADEEAIELGLKEAEALMDPEEIAILRALDPDLVPSFEHDGGNDAESIPLLDEDGQPMNRQKRREMERKQRRLKKPDSKGFG